MKRALITASVFLATVLLGMCILVGVTVFRQNGSPENAVTTLDLRGKRAPDLTHVMEMKSLRHLDLRDTGITEAQYAQLRQALPACSILWDIPFQGQLFSQDARQLTVSSLTEHDLTLLSYFSQLAEIDARECTDFELLDRLAQQLPDCRILRKVPLQGSVYDASTTSLTLKDADAKTLTQALAGLYELRQVRLTGTLPDARLLADAAAAYPQVSVQWDCTLFGRSFPSTAAEIDLSGIAIADPSLVEQALPYLPQVERVILCDCGISDEEMDALCKRNPDIRFVWTVELSRCKLRTDITSFMAWNYDYLPGYPLYDSDAQKLKYCVDMVCLDLGHMQITNCDFVRYMPNLEYLILADTKVADLSPVKDLKNLKFLEIFLTEISDISPLAGCSGLEDVNMSYLTLDSVAPLEGLPNLKHVWMVGGLCPAEELASLQSSHPDTRILQIFGLNLSSTGYGWRDTENYKTMRDLLGMVYMVG